MQVESENLTIYALVLLIVIAFLATWYCSEPQGIPNLTENPVIVSPYLSHKSLTCTVVNSQYDDPPSRAPTTTYTSSMGSIISSAQLGTTSTTTTI